MTTLSAFFYEKAFHPELPHHVATWVDLGSNRELTFISWEVQEPSNCDRYYEVNLNCSTLLPGA